MSITITRTLMLDEVVTPDGELRRRVPVFAGQRLFVHADYDQDQDYDWMAPVEGGLLPLPPDAWAPD